MPAFAGCRVYTLIRIRSNPVTRPNHLPSSTGYKPAPLTKSETLAMCLIVQESKLPEPTRGLPSLVGAVKPRLVECDSNWLEPGVPHYLTRLVRHEISLCSQAYLDNGRSRWVETNASGELGPKIIRPPVFWAVDHFSLGHCPLVGVALACVDFACCSVCPCVPVEASA